MISKTRFIIREVFPITCPDCNLSGMIDKDQHSGKVGIMCPVCGWCDYSRRGLTDE